MALTQDDPLAPTFQWGSNGTRLTPEQIVAQRKVADALALQAGDQSAFPTGTRGAGLLTQGLARVAKGVSAGFDYREADQAAAKNADDNKAMIAALLGGGAAQPVAAAPAAAVASPVAPAAPGPAPVAADTTGKIYRNDEPSPLDPPSGADRDNAIRTVYGEAGNEPTKGQLAVASVIRNRAVDGGYGGDTPTAVVRAPNQFEPWNGGPALTRMQALSPDSPQYAAIGKVVDAAYGTGGRAPDDPTEGKTMFYSPAAQAALGRPAPSWAKGDGQVIGGHTFYDEPEDASQGKPVQVASAVPAAFAAPAAPSPGVAAVTAAAAGIPAPVVAPAAAVAKVASPLAGINPAVLQAATSPYADDSTKKIANVILASQLGKEKKDTYSQRTDADGNKYDVNDATHERKMFSAAEKTTGAQKDFEYGQTHPDFVRQQLERTKAGAAQLNNQNNIDMNSGQTYDKQLAEGLGKSHAALANGVEDAQARARDIAAMQGAVDQIQKNGGTTGGMAPAARLELQKSINAGANALGIEKPFSEDDISDKEFLTKFNRSMAGAQAKNAVGSRVTNFEMSNFLKANPGLDMSITGNQRLLGIQSQIEQRNIAVGNSIRDATAEAISAGKKIDPVTVQGIVTAYDKAHHIQDPTTGQDLTQSVALPEFQTQANNPALAADHAANIGKLQRTGTGVGWSVH
jgi:spore germination cell wall hydrolase CwlJ-like protein